jgi:hypothetical protein
MMNPLSSATLISQVPSPQTTAQSRPPQASSSGPQDTIHLSSAAQTHVSQDIDHDGDSR